MFDETRLVERVGVDRHLDVHLFSDRQTVVDGRRGCAPVLVQFEADGARLDLFGERSGQACVALAEIAEIHRKGFGRLQHLADVPGPRRAGGGVGAGGRTGTTPQHGGHTAHQGLFDLLRADEMDVAVDATRGDDHSLAGDYLGTRPDDDLHAGLDVRVAGLADTGDAPVLDADVGLDDAPVVDDQGVGDHRVGHFGREALALAHAIADYLATTKLHLLAIEGEVLLDLDPQFGIGQPQAVAHRWAEHFRIGLPGNLCDHQSAPMT